MRTDTALLPVGRDLYLLGVEEGFRLGYLAAGEVVAEGIGAARWRFREQLMARHRRHFEERLARGVTDAVATLEARANQGERHEQESFAGAEYGRSEETWSRRGQEKR